MLQAILSAILMRPCPSARSPLVLRTPRRIVLGMPGLKGHHNQLEMVSSVRTRVGWRTTRSRTADFEGFRRHIAGSVRNRIVPLCDVCVWEIETGRQCMSALRSGLTIMLTPGRALVGLALATNNYVEQAGYVTGVRCAVKDRLQ
jgi:hypothetical protein